MPKDNSILIGRKPVMNYVLACISLFHGGANQIVVKARDRSITRAVDVAEVTRRRFMPDLKVKKIEIDTKQLTQFNEYSTSSNVSTIENLS